MTPPPHSHTMRFSVGEWPLSCHFRNSSGRHGGHSVAAVYSVASFGAENAYLQVEIANQTVQVIDVDTQQSRGSAIILACFSQHAEDYVFLCDTDSFMIVVWSLRVACNAEQNLFRKILSKDFAR